MSSSSELPAPWRPWPSALAASPPGRGPSAPDPKGGGHKDHPDLFRFAVVHGFVYVLLFFYGLLICLFVYLLVYVCFILVHVGLFGLISLYSTLWGGATSLRPKPGCILRSFETKSHVCGPPLSSAWMAARRLRRDGEDENPGAERSSPIRCSHCLALKAWTGKDKDISMIHCMIRLT